MLKLCFLFISVLLIAGCKTNPPIDPNAISVNAGEIAIRISFTQNSAMSNSKKVLLEDFANVSCGPCVVSNQIIERLTRTTYGPQKIASIKFPTNFPSPNDPFYLANKNASNFRMSYYNILLAPTIIIDGITRPVAADSNSYKQAIDARLSSQSNFKLEIAKQLKSGGLVFILNIQAKDTSAIVFDDLYLRFAIIESKIEFANPPGSNGETKFHDVTRTLFPSNDGFVLSDLKSFTGIGNTFLFQNSINSTWDINQLNAVVFIQNKTSKEVLQAGSTY